MRALTVRLSPRLSAFAGAAVLAGVGSLAWVAAQAGGMEAALRWCQNRFVASAGSRGEAVSAVALAVLGAAGAWATARLAAFVVSEILQRLRVEREFAARKLPLTRVVRVAAAATAEGFGVSLVDDDRPFALSIGMLRPRIVVSRALSSACTIAEMRAVLAHEAAHCRAKHPLSAVFWEGVRRVSVFAPVVEDIVDHLALAREVAADAHARIIAGRRALASALLKAADGVHAPHAIAAFGRVGDRARALASSSRDAPLRITVPRLFSTVALVALFGGLASAADAGAGRDSPDLCESDVLAMSTINFSPYLSIRVPQMSIAPGLQSEARP